MELNLDTSGQRGGGHHGGDDSKGRFGFDLNIDNYSTDDLLEIYKITKINKGNITEDYVKKMTDDIIQQYRNYNADSLSGDMPFSDNYSDDDQYIAFFNNAQKRIMQYLQSGVSFINDGIEGASAPAGGGGASKSTDKSHHRLIQNYAPSSQLSDGDKLVMMPKEDSRVQMINPTIATPTIIHEYTKGVVNPLERRTLKRIISIDTLFRQNHDKSKATDFIWNLPTPINNVVSLRVVSMEMPNSIRMFSNDKKNNIFTIHLYNVRQVYNEGGQQKTVFINHSETLIIPEGFYTSTQFPEMMNYYLSNAGTPSNGKVVRDASGHILPIPYDASANQLVFNGLKLLVMEVNDISSRTIIRTREETDTLPDLTDDTLPLKRYRAFYQDETTNPQYSPDFYFNLDFNIENDRSFTDYYKLGGLFVRNVTYGLDICGNRYMIDPDPSGNECATSSVSRSRMTSRNLQCFRPKLDPYTGNIMKSNTKMRPLYKNAGWTMGFYNDTYDVTKPYVVQGRVNPLGTYEPVTYGRYIESESSYGSSIVQYYFLEVDDYNRNFTTNTIVAETGNGTNLGNNIIARIPLTTAALNINYLNPSDMIFKQRDYFGPVKIEKIHLRLVDRFGDTLDIQNNDYSLAIELTTTY
jgi:hypothetical protein